MLSSTEFKTHTHIHYPWTLNSHPSLGNIASAVSFMEPFYWKCICSSCVSKESAYLMLTSCNLACKQTWSPLLRLKITTRSLGWVKEETERKEGRCRERKEKKEMWRKGMRWSQCTVGVELKSLNRRSRLLFRSVCVCVPQGRFEAW